MKVPKKVQAQIDRFNSEHPVGSLVMVRLDSGELRAFTVRHEATALGGHTAVGWFDGITGAYALDRVTGPAIDTPETVAAKCQQAKRIGHLFSEVMRGAL